MRLTAVNSVQYPGTEANLLLSGVIAIFKNFVSGVI